jgi:hypothetical protein
MILKASIHQQLTDKGDLVPSFPSFFFERDILSSPLQTPFDSVENAHEYLRMLVEAVAEAESEVKSDVAIASRSDAGRRLEALRLVQFKLERLEQHLRTSGRLLNDLRTLRRLLLEERLMPMPVEEAVAIRK